MKKRIIKVAAFALLISTILGANSFSTKNIMAASAFERVGFVNAEVTATALNVRQAASLTAHVTCILKKGQQVKIFGKIGDWYAIYEPVSGCVGVASSKYIKSKETAPAPTKAPTKAPVKNPPVQKMPTPVPKPTNVPTKAPAAIATPIPSTDSSLPQGISADEQKVLDLVNKARADAGIGAMQFDMNLEKVARLKAKDMVDNNYFSHQSPTYGSPFDMMKKFGVSFKTAGENIAGNSSVEGAFNAWMNSEGHRKNIMNGNFNYTGIGVVSSSTYGKMFVQQFIGK